MSITAPDILDKAAGHMRDRASTYDSAKGERSMGKAVAMFNACHGTQLTEEQGWHLMELVKHVRYFTAPGYHADSVEDGAAYAALRGEAGAAKAHEPASEIDDESERQQLVQQSVKELTSLRDQKYYYEAPEGHNKFYWVPIEYVFN